jgi:5-methyltetrahydrofolate--homocysteine methyltransferase
VQKPEGLCVQIRSALLKGRSESVKELIQSCLELDMAPREVLEQGLVAGMAVVGQRFRDNEMFMPEVMVAARAMHAGLGVLEPLLAAGGAEPKGTVLVGTVKGDLHDVGKNMVSMMFRGAGYRLVDLGVDVAPEAFVKAIREHRPQVVGLSALLTMTLPQIKAAIEAVEQSGLRREVVLLAGGAPVTAEYAAAVGADGWAPDSAGAVQLAGELLAVRRA